MIFLLCMYSSPLPPSLAQTKEGGEKAFSPSLRSTTLYIHLVKTGRPYEAHYLIIIINLIYKQIVPTGLNAA